MNKITSFLKKPLLLKRLWRKLLSPFYFEQWVLMIRRQEEGEHIPNWQGWKPLLPPRDRLWADPFLWQHDDRAYVFYEEFPFNTMRGHISCIELDTNLNIISNEIVLQRPHHLSYPFLFEYENELYMLPETSQNRTIEVYRCEKFPHQWVHAGILMPNVTALDSTLLEHDGRWWLFTNMTKNRGDAYKDLHIFYANTPLSKAWTPHPKNPVIEDIRRARPAGQIFKCGNKQIRPSQDCYIRYGYGINFNHIQLLTDAEYMESTDSTLIPPTNNWQILATHTWNKSQNLQVIDAELWQRK